jgi:hypothetical protein
MENRKAKQVLSGKLVQVRRGKEGVKRENMVEILCTRGCKWKK